jgi:hypothetical protein
MFFHCLMTLSTLQGYSYSARFGVVSAFVNAAEVLMSLIYFYVPVPEISSPVLAVHA